MLLCIADLRTTLQQKGTSLKPYRKEVLKNWNRPCGLWKPDCRARDELMETWGRVKGRSTCLFSPCTWWLAVFPSFAYGMSPIAWRPWNSPSRMPLPTLCWPLGAHFFGDHRRFPLWAVVELKSVRCYFHLNGEQLHYCIWKAPRLGPRPCDRGDKEVGPLPSMKPVTSLCISCKDPGVALSHTFSEWAMSSAVQASGLGSGCPLSQSLPTHSRADEIWFVVGFCGSLVSEEGLV